jgi:hypothetical protein
MKASQLRELIRELIQGHLDEMSTTGALVQPGGQQIATTKAFTSMRDWKKVNKNRKWEESINEETGADEVFVKNLKKVIQQKFKFNPKITLMPNKSIVVFYPTFLRKQLHPFFDSLMEEGAIGDFGRTGVGIVVTNVENKSDNTTLKWASQPYKNLNESFTIDPDKQLANIKDAWDDGLHTGRTTSTPSDAERKWEEFKSRTNINESITESYRRFKKKVTNPRQQMNNSVREIEKHLREVDKIVEYNLKLKTEMDLGGGNFFEGTNKRLARISERINHLNNKLKELGN